MWTMTAKYLLAMYRSVSDTCLEVRRSRISVSLTYYAMEIVLMRCINSTPDVMKEQDKITQLNWTSSVLINALQQLQSTTGSCYYTYIAITGSPTAARSTFEWCGVKSAWGLLHWSLHKSDTIVPPDVGGGDKACQHLTLSSGYVNPDLISNFCNSDCTMPVYIRLYILPRM